MVLWISVKKRMIKNMNARVDELAQKIWDYHQMHQSLAKADCILALGSHDIRVADRSAELFLDSWAPLILFSGGRGRLMPEEWPEPEADMFKKRAETLGVPKDKILVENKSTNTGENILFTKELLLRHGLNPQKIILVQKPYMERRAYATFKKIWPEKNFIVTSPQVSFKNYPTDKIPKDLVISIMIGELQRIKIYPEKGFQIAQDIPRDVWAAYEELVSLGYTDHLIKK